MVSLSPSLVRATVSVAVGCCGAVSGAHVLGMFDGAGGLKGVGYALLGLASSLVAHYLLYGVVRPRLAAYSCPARAAWVVGSVLTAGALIVVIPMRILASAAVLSPGADAGLVRALAVLLVGGAAVVSLAALVLAVGVWLVTRAGPAVVPTVMPRGAWLAYAAPAAGVWLLWLLTFWPGIL